MVILTYYEPPVGNSAKPVIQQGTFSQPLHRIIVYVGRQSYAMILECEHKRPLTHRGPKSQMGVAIYHVPG